MSSCLQCEAQLTKYNSKYCSNLCQSNHNLAEYINKWHQGYVNGSRGVNTKNLSGHLIRYVMEKYKTQCARCGWHKVNASTGNVTLEIDHIDGNSENNSESNLILLCPNCHSLTPNYKNLNKGSGRLWRREKYVKIV